MRKSKNEKENKKIEQQISGHLKLVEEIEARLKKGEITTETIEGMKTICQITSVLLQKVKVQ